MNIDFDKIIENLNGSENEYKIYLHKVMILQVIKQIFVKFQRVKEKLFTMICL